LLLICLLLQLRVMRTYKKQSEDNFIYGTRAIIEAILAGREIDKLIIQKDLRNDLIRETLSLAGQHSIPVSMAPIEKLNRITRKNHQGAVAFLSAIEFASVDHIIENSFQQGKNPFLVALDGVTDVRNFGAIARTAECAGVDALLIPGKGSAQINSDAVKTSAGALNHIPVCREKNLAQSMKYLKNNGLVVIAATEKADKSVYEVDFSNPLVLLLGSEETGISADLLKLADEWASIPHFGNIASLNVSVAAAIFIYEVVRQRSGVKRRKE
jgi:23S rRNA (guanosine2251-2'-O)-methyltransferase